MPLEVAPLLTLEELQTVKTLAVTDHEDERPQHTFTRGYTVTSFEWHNTTYVKFHTTAGDEVIISRAAAHIVKPSGTIHSTCGGNAGCASFEAHGHDVEALMQEARELWAAHPLPEVDPESWAKSPLARPRDSKEHVRRRANATAATNATATTTFTTSSNASSPGRRTLAASNSGGGTKRELDGGKWMNHVDTTDELAYFANNAYHNVPPAKGMQHPEWGHLAGQPCSKRRARRRLAWEPHKPGLDWSWMRSEPADPEKRAQERRRLNPEFDAVWAAWNASDMSTEDQDLTLQVKKCLNSTSEDGVCEEYAEYLNKILHLSKLNCLVCVDKSGGRLRQLSSSQLSSSGPTWCVHTLADLYDNTKDIEGESILDTLANAAFAGEVDPKGIPGAIATAEQAYSFYTRMYLDQGEPAPSDGDRNGHSTHIAQHNTAQHNQHMLVCAALNEYKNDKSVAISKYGTIDTWDVSVIRDFSWLFLHAPLPAEADLSKWNTRSAVIVA